MQLFHNQPLPPCGSSTRRGRGVYITRNTTGLNYFDFCAFESFRFSVSLVRGGRRLSPVPQTLTTSSCPPAPLLRTYILLVAARLALFRTRTVL